MEHFFQTAQWDPNANIDGVSKAQRVRMFAIAKTNEELTYCIPNEFIASHLGRILGLPLPPSGLCQIPQRAANTPAFVSLEFNLRQQSLPFIDPDDAVNKIPDVCTGVLLFDVLIANPDRHIKNLRALLSRRPYELLVFDHSHALLGHDDANALQRLTDLRDRLGVSGGSVTGQHRHCFLDSLKDGSLFSKWIERIEQLPDFVIDHACQTMKEGSFLDDAEASSVSDFLKYRRTNFSSIISNHRAEFKGIAQWGLFP